MQRFFFRADQTAAEEADAERAALRKDGDSAVSDSVAPSNPHQHVGSNTGVSTSRDGDSVIV